MKRDTQGHHWWQVLLTIGGIIILLYAQWFMLGQVWLEQAIQSMGYWGVFIFSFINGFNVLFPVITSSFTPILVQSGLEIEILIIVMSVGMSMADMVGYFVGRHVGILGKTEDAKWLVYMQQLKQRNYYLPLVFALAWGLVVPLPYELVIIPLGMMLYRPQVVLTISIIANIFYNTVTAIGFMGMFSLFS